MSVFFLLLGLFFTFLILLTLIWFFRKERPNNSKPKGDDLKEKKGEVKKTEEKKKGEKKGLSPWWLLVVVVIAVVLTWGFSTSWGKSTAVTIPAASTGMQAVQPKEEWVFEWSTSSNEGRTFEAKIDKCDSESLWFSTPYSCGGTVRIATYMLTKSGENYSGSWSQNSPKDSGTLFLKKDGYQRYVGQITDAEKTTAVITLKRK